MTEIDRQKEKRRLKRENGICIDCSEPAAAGRVRCEKHYHEHNERSAAWAKQKRDESILEKQDVVIVGRPWWVSFEENYTHEKLEALNGQAKAK